MNYYTRHIDYFEYILYQSNSKIRFNMFANFNFINTLKFGFKILKTL